MQFKKLVALTVAALLCVSLFGCKGQTDTQPGPNQTNDPTAALEEQGLVILYTSDIHGNFYLDESAGVMGYAALYTYMKELEAAGKTVMLVDGGDAMCQQMDGRLTNARDVIKIMGKMGYDAAVPGAGEFAQGVEAFMEAAKNSSMYVSCNLVYSQTGEPVFAPYRLIHCDLAKVAFVGVCQPASMPGNDTYEVLDGEQLIEYLNNAADLARAEGADFVFAVGPMGDLHQDNVTTATQLICSAVGLNGFLGGYSHSVVPGDLIVDGQNEDLPLILVGENMKVIGQIELDWNDRGVVVSMVQGLTEQDTGILEAIETVEQLGISDEYPTEEWIEE